MPPADTRSPRLRPRPYTLYAARGHRRRRVARVALTAAVFLTIVVAIAAGGAYVWLDGLVGRANEGPQASTIQSVIDATPDTAIVDAEYDKPDAQDILILGSDTREGEGDEYGRSDTLMIMHIDPVEDYVSVLSIPRDLRVEIPGHGVQKINAAFAFGGPALAIQTVQRATRLDIDHYVNVDFEAFRSVTTALGGIYVDVDRRYYYGGIAYENINIPAGYQRLAGEQALDYVRFRHDGNVDFGRIERQHRFLQAARDQVSTWDTALKVPELVQLVAQNVSTDVTTTEALRLALWGLRLDRTRINQVNLVAETRDIGGASYVVATDDAIREAVRDLVTAPRPELPDDTATTDTTAGTATTSGDPSNTTPEPVDLTGVTVNVFNGNGRSGEATATGEWLESMGATIGRIGDAASSENELSVVLYPPEREGAARLVAAGVGVDRLREDRPGGEIALVLGADFALPEAYRPVPTAADVPDVRRWNEISRSASFTVMAPMSIPENFKFTDYRLYDLNTNEAVYPALKVYYRHGREDQYMGLMQTTFLDAPLAARGEERSQNGVVYTGVTIDGKVDRVWWKVDGVLYWVSNTLGYHVSSEEMFGVAESMIPMR